MKQFFILTAFAFIMVHAYSQSCVTTYNTVNVTVDCHSYPYYYANTGYSYPGTYTVYLVNSKGCDSIVTLNISFPPAGSDTNNLTICATELPYYWDQEIDQAGTYYKFTNINSCNPELQNDHVSVLNLTVLAADTVVIHDTACYSQFPIEWGGQEINGSGTYTGVVANSGHGKCGTIGILYLTTVDQPTSTTDKTICSAQLPYAWNGQTLTAAGFYYATIVTPNPKDCDSLAQLNLIVTNNKSSTATISICANQLPYGWNGQNYTTTGTYTKNFPTGTACDSIATLNLTVKPLSTILSFSPTTATKGQAVVITGTNFNDASAVSFGGTPASSFTIQSATSIIAIVGAAINGSVAVRTGCDTASLAGFTYNPNQGGIGIGTNTPTSKLTISGGDIQVTDVGSGIILKSPNGKCYRLSMGNTPNINGLTIIEVPCPQ